jgi:hypothetical protein
MPKPGYISASQFKKVMVRGKKGESFGLVAESYAEEIIMEMIGVQLPSVFSKEMEWGEDHEWDAIDAYQQDQLVTVNRDFDFLVHPVIESVGGTPDGLVGSDGLIEVKCPYNPRWHFKNLVSNYQFDKDTGEYYEQIQGYMMITGRAWCDCVSFDPRWPKDFQLAIHRVNRDDQFIAELEARLIEFKAFILTIKNRVAT